MTRRYFGTDGVRGIVGDGLSTDLVERLGRAFAVWSEAGSVLVGRDTRPSGPELEHALAAGLASGGSEVVLGGVLPTPAVAVLADESGAVVSASHNPEAYNGVKFFAGGAKLTDEQEEAVEALLDAPPVGAWGGIDERTGLQDLYLDLVCERFGAPLQGLRVVLDCANGALYEIAPRAFARLGADVVSVGVDPAAPINDGCGATDLGLVAETVRESGADLGLAFDGDGDRMLAVDAEGKEIDGDQIVAILALDLGVDLVVVTSMTNLGFHRLMRERGIRVVTTDVGDRYVLDALRREGGVLGGEQSGHIIVLRGQTTGDGLAAGLMLCGIVAESGRTLGEAAAVMPRWPQEKRNVRVRTKELPDDLLAAVESENERLGDRARILVRPSGTEPVVRVLAEAENAAEARNLCVRMAVLVERAIGTVRT